MYCKEGLLLTIFSCFFKCASQRPHLWTLNKNTTLFSCLLLCLST